MCRLRFLVDDKGFPLNSADEDRFPPALEPEPLEVTEFLPPREPPPFRPAPKVWRLSLILFAVTCASTFYIGMTNYPEFPPEVAPETIVPQLLHGGPQQGVIIRSFLWSGFQYSAALMSILLCHELGHYVQARRYHVPAIPPMFIPMPFRPFGTMGAVIVQSPHHADRKAMFDIAISGPLAGLFVALPIAWWGILHSKIAVSDRTSAAEVFGDPLVLKWMIQLVHGPLAPNQDVLINPLLMAGWVGVFITALNLAPIGQLDGGHILYCLIGRRAHAVALLFVVMVVAYMAVTNYWLFSIMIVLMVMMGLRHPPTANDHVPLGPGRVILGWLTLAFLLIGIHPRPFDQRLPRPVDVESPPSAMQPENAGLPLAQPALAS
jgi:hypothetical protein